MQTRPVAKQVPGSRAAIEVRSQAPFAVDVVLWRDESGRVLATVVAKATYDLAQGTSALVEPPDPIRADDENWDDRAAGSLRFSSDLAPFKPANELLVVGHVYATGNRPTRSATARIVVGPIEKLTAASAPRRFDRDGQLHLGLPQTRFSLRYELAAGGVDNPAGVDPTDFTSDGGHAVPQLTPPNFDVRPGNYVPLVGLGPVSASWRPRDSLLRPEDREWLADLMGRPRPRGFDPRYFCAAPVDQRSAEPFRADERLILEGLHPTHARLVTTLAGTSPALRSAGARSALPPFVADTLTVDTDRGIANLTFRAVVPLGQDELVVDVVVEGDDSPTSGLGGDSTTELETSSLREPPLGVGGDSTTELDRSAFSEAASSGLPFAPTSEPGRARLPSTADGTLPFRPSSPPPPASAPRASAPHTSSLAHTSSPTRRSSLPLPPPLPPQPPPLVTRPPEEALTEVALPVRTPPSATFTPSHIRSEEVERRVEVPPARISDAVARAEEKNPFRRAFGAGAGVEPGLPKPATTPAAGAGGTKASTDTGPVASGSKPSLDAAVALGGARAASDAAIAAAARMRATLATPVDQPPTLTRRAVVDLLAFDSGVPNRLRKSKTHAPLLAVVAPVRTARKVDAPAGEQTPEDRARSEVLRILSCGAPLGAEELHIAVDELFDDPHDFEIPLLLVEGDVKPTMDEVETLRVAVEIAKPLAGTNKRVQGAIAVATDALARSVPPLPETAAALYKQLEASTTELPLPSRHVAEVVERTLLEARSFKTRMLLGSLRIRAELTMGRLVLPIYLPETVSSQLPLLPVFSLAALVELRPREDASEPNPTALVAFALGRVLRARK